MSQNKKIIVFDTETTGFSPVKNEIVQLSYILYDTETQSVLYATTPGDDIVNINGKIPKQTSDIHGITKEMTLDKRPIKDHIDAFITYCNEADQFVGHNVGFDIKMIVGQINKIIQASPDEAERYTEFLNRFQLVGSNLPDDAYCTMNESKGICAQIIGTNRIRKKKLMEVHQLLFNQDVGGQLHNALVDIAVTLRVFLKLTLDVDICKSMTEFNNVTNVTNNNDICSLIKPINMNINQPIDNVEYNGDLITGLTTLPTNDGFEEEKVMVQTYANKLATEMVSNIQKQAMTNILSRVAPADNFCTSITICRTILKSGVRKGQSCNRPTKQSEFCHYHKPKTSTVIPQPNSLPNNLDENYNSDIQTKPSVQPEPQPSSTNFISNLFTGTKKNRVVPMGGKKRNKKGKTVKKRHRISNKKRRR
jgi:DNA polymerase III epsilon subunit-like protein